MRSHAVHEEPAADDDGDGGGGGGSSAPGSTMHRPPRTVAPRAPTSPAQPLASRVPTALPPARLPSVVLARDLPRGVLDAEVKAGRLVRVRRGAYLSRTDLPGDSPDARLQLALARIAAVAACIGPSAVVSHQSAALVWGLPTWHLPTTVHLLHPVRRSGRSAADVTWHHCRPPDRLTTAFSGLRITSLEQTVVDCLTTAPPLDAVVVADAALARGVDRDQTDRLLQGLRGRRGAARGRELLDLAATGSQSPWESACRVVVQAVGLPLPDTQIRVDTDLGRFYADMGWRQWRLLLEFDGAVKYSGSSRAATSALMAEKRRQHAMEDTGWRVIRATAADLGPSLPLVRRLRALLPDAAFRTTRPRLHLLNDLHPPPRLPTSRS